MHTSQAKKMSNIPFAVVDDDAWARMQRTLREGAPFVKTYLTTCPHQNKNQCVCSHYKNYWDAEDEEIYRIENGQRKTVIPLRMLMRVMMRLSGGR